MKSDERQQKPGEEIETIDEIKKETENEVIIQFYFKLHTHYALILIHPLFWRFC